MATNDFLVWSGSQSANALTQAEYLALSNLATGVVTGLASSQQANKTWRQASIIAAAVAQTIVDVLGVDATDDGTTTALEASIIALFQGGGGLYAVDTGAVNALTIALSPTPSGLSTLTGLVLRVLPANTSTGAATITVNGLAATPVVNPDGSALVAGQIAANSPVAVIYNGTNFVLVAGTAALEGTSLTTSGAAKVGGALNVTGSAAISGALSAFGPLGPNGFGNVVVFTNATNTWTVPAGVTKVRVLCIAGGGGGSGAQDGDTYAGTGGGAGGTAYGIYTVTSGQEISIDVGAGGAGGSSDAAGSPGSASSFGLYCSASGGSGGHYGPYNDQSISPGGAGSGGSINFQGQSGNVPTILYNGLVIGGNGGGATWGGSGGCGVGGLPESGHYPGGGGAAAGLTTGIGGAAGAQGVVIVWY